MSPSRRAITTLPFLLLLGCPKAIPVPVDPPEARVDYVVTPLNTPVTLSPLVNDFDPTNEVISVVSIGTPGHGTAVLNGNGTVDYTPANGYLGGDHFTVTIVDASGWEASNEAYVKVGTAQRVAYRSNYTDFFTFQVYMVDTASPLGIVPINARIPITVGPVASHQQVQQYIPSADGINMIYVADDSDEFGISNLFHVDLRTPGIATRLTDIQDGQAIGSFSLPQLAPDALHAYYLSNEADPNLFQIMQVEVANPANKVVLNSAMTFVPAPAESDLIEHFSVSPDGNYMLYVMRDHDGGNGGTTALSELRVVDLSNPGVSTVISGNPTAGLFGVAGSTGALAFQFVPGTTKVVYASSENGLTTVDFYIVDYVTPTTPVKLSGTNLGVPPLNYGFTPDGSRILYVSAEDFTTVYDLYAVQIATPGVSTRLSKHRTDNGQVGSFSIGQDSSFALYVRDDDTVGVRELYYVDFSKPSVQTKLNHQLRAVGADPVTEPAEVVLSVRVSAGAPRRVLYSSNEIPDADHVPHQTFRIVDVDNPGVTSVVGPPVFTGHAFAWMPDGDTVIHQESAPENIHATTLNMFRISAPTVDTRLTPERHGGDQAAEFSFIP
jgi:Tol biopolymer transport system component